MRKNSDFYGKGTPFPMVRLFYHIKALLVKKGAFMSEKKTDRKGRILRIGEFQRADGRYQYRYTDLLGARQCIYSWKLLPSDKIPNGIRADLSLREKEIDTMCRVSELAGLTWDDIDLKKKYVIIDHQLLYKKFDSDEKTTYHIKSTKGDNERKIPMTNKLYSL